MLGLPSENNENSTSVSQDADDVMNAGTVQHGWLAVMRATFTLLTRTRTCAAKGTTLQADGDDDADSFGKGLTDMRKRENVYFGAFSVTEIPHSIVISLLP